MSNLAPPQLTAGKSPRTRGVSAMVCTYIILSPSISPHLPYYHDETDRSNRHILLFSQKALQKRYHRGRYQDHAQ